MVSLPLEKIRSTATAEPEKDVNRIKFIKQNPTNLEYKGYHTQDGKGLANPPVGSSTI
jgi:hypothetical protein